MWKKRIIVGNDHHEYRVDDTTDGYLFNIEKNASGVVRLYDLRDMPATYYLFQSVREAKKIAVKSITDKSVLEPFIDKKWYEDQARFVKVIKDTDELLAKLRKEHGL